MVDLKHTILGGKVHVYRRENSSAWQCSTYLAGKNRRVSTKEESLSLAKQFAEDWYLGLRGKVREGGLTSEKTFKDAAKRFAVEYEVITQGERAKRYVEDHQRRLRLHLTPYFGSMPLSHIKSGVVQEYRVMRLNNEKPPSKSTLHQELVTLRQVMKTAIRLEWIEHLPDFSLPYRASSKISHRAWFSPDEYKQFYTATRAKVQEAKGKSWQWAAEQMHDYVLFMANTGMRPDEANNLEFRDVDIVDDEGSGETILEIEVRGKRGVGYCKSTKGAVLPFKRLRTRERPDADCIKTQPKPTDRVFPAYHKKQFNRVLDEQGLKLDREGNRRTAYSLRHTYICLRLLEGADIYQIAKNCRTSVEMIEKYYASHLKNAIDASAINVRRSRTRKLM